MDALFLGAVFLAWGSLGCLTWVNDICLPLLNWTTLSQNSQLLWCQLAVVLANVCHSLDEEIIPLAHLRKTPLPHGLAESPPPPCTSCQIQSQPRSPERCKDPDVDQ